MERVEPDQTKDLKIFIFSYVGISVVSHTFFKVNNVVIFALGVFLSFTFLLKYLFDHATYSSIFFSEKGMIFKTLMQSREIIWKDLIVHVKNKNNEKIVLVLKSSAFERKIKIDYLILKSIFKLTKKYCPQGHEFYKVIEEYSKNKNIPF